MNRRHRQVQDARQVTHHEKRPHHRRHGADVHHPLIAQPIVDEHPHAGEPHEPQEESNGPAPVSDFNLGGKKRSINHLDTTT